MSARLDFRSRHLGPVDSDRKEMLRETGYPSLTALINAAVPAGIRSSDGLARYEPTSRCESVVGIVLGATVLAVGRCSSSS